jgi:hypothetical protein
MAKEGQEVRAADESRLGNEILLFDAEHLAPDLSGIARPQDRYA